MYKESQTNYLQRGFEEILDNAYELYRLKKIKEQREGLKQKRVATSVQEQVPQKQLAPSPQDFVNEVRRVFKV